MKGKSKRDIWNICGLFLTIVFVIATLSYLKPTISVEMYDNPVTNEANCKYVSSRGILKSCDVRSSNPISSIKGLDGIDLSSIREGSTLYIPGSAIPEFAKRLGTIKYSFILVSGDCDETITEAIFNDAEFNAFISSNKIIHWYSQNCTRIHPKLSQIPIGLDYHSSSNKGKQKVSPLEEEAYLLDLQSIMRPFNERKIACYSNFHFNITDDCVKTKYCYDRKDAQEKIPKKLVNYEKRIVPRSQSWKTQLDYAFVISPHGHGLDCHRTWEALVLGCIPIVKTSALDPLYDELPVLIVKDWGDVTQKLLEGTVNAFKTRRFNYDKLTLKYWMNKINSAKME